MYPAKGNHIRISLVGAVSCRTTTFLFTFNSASNLSGLSGG
ncbi:MAG: hypothetical protein N3F06_03525 [Nitrososphaerales archaeon]|nr:hypothetical protein [Nitrososphaerales archaeon]